MLPECSCQYDSQYTAVNAAAIPNPVITTAAATILAMDFQFSLHHSATDFKPSLIFPSRFSRFPVLNIIFFVKIFFPFIDKLSHFFIDTYYFRYKLLAFTAEFSSESIFLS